VQTTFTDTGLLWRNSVPENYTFTKVGADTYQYAGPNGVGTGTVTLQVTFTSNTSFQLFQTFVSNGEPECTHTYTQTGTFMWFSP